MREIGFRRALQASASLDAVYRVWPARGSAGEICVFRTNEHASSCAIANADTNIDANTSNNTSTNTDAFVSVAIAPTPVKLTRHTYYGLPLNDSMASFNGKPEEPAGGRD